MDVLPKLAKIIRIVPTGQVIVSGDLSHEIVLVAESRTEGKVYIVEQI